MIAKIHTIIKDVLGSQSLDARTCFTDVYPEPPDGGTVVFECSSADISTEVESEIVRQAGARAAAVRYVLLPNGGVLNRYWDDNPAPRQEAYWEDVEVARHSDRIPEVAYRDLRAAAESGWDFSSRWLPTNTGTWTSHT